MRKWMMAGLAVLVTAAAARGQATLKIGVVDLDRVLEEYKKKQDAEAKLKNDYDTELKKLEESLARIREKNQELSVLEKGSTEYDLRQLEAEVERYRIKLEQESLGRRHEKNRTAKMRELYLDIVKKVEEYGKANGFSAILAKRGDFKPEDRRELLTLIISQSVLYHDPGLDVTQEVLKLLNKDAAAAPPQPANGGPERKGGQK
jgi:outer membrane protein